MFKVVLFFFLVLLIHSEPVGASSAESVLNENSYALLSTDTSVPPYIATQNNQSLTSTAIASTSEKKSNQQLIPDETTVDEMRNIDLSEPSSVILIGVGVAIIVLARKRKFLHT